MHSPSTSSWVTRSRSGAAWAKGFTEAEHRGERMAGQDTSMAGKTCLVTGATAGIGEVTARELARRGARVVLLGRSRERCEATAKAIGRETGSPAVEYLVADLS